MNKKIKIVVLAIIVCHSTVQASLPKLVGAAIIAGGVAVAYKYNNDPDMIKAKQAGINSCRKIWSGFKDGFNSFTNDESVKKAAQKVKDDVDKGLDGSIKATTTVIVRETKEALAAVNEGIKAAQNPVAGEKNSTEADKQS